MDDIVPADHGVEQGAETGGGEEGVEISLGGRGGDRPGNPLLLEGEEEFAGSGEDLHAVNRHEGAVEFLLAVGQFANRRWILRPSERGNDHLVLLAEAGLEVALRKRKTPFGGQKLPGTLVLGRGVDHDPVPVKEDTPGVVHRLINGSHD